MLYRERVNDVFVGILTQCVTLALSTFFGQTAGSEWHVGKVFLGGYNGMNGISPLYIGSYKISGFSGYYLSAIILFACLLIFKIVERSKAGYTLFAVRENRERSSLFGYDVPKIHGYKKYERSQRMVFDISRDHTVNICS